jgi:phosphatidate cytidylyltransferase
MALNFSVFRVRALSAIVFVIVMLGGLVWNNWSFFLLFVAIATGCLFEYQKLLAKIFPSYKNISPVHKWGLLVLGVVLMMTLAPNSLGVKDVSIKYLGSRILPIVIGGLVAGELINYKKGFILQNWAISFFGLAYIPMALSLFFQLKGFMANTFFGDWSFSIPLLVIATVWVNDTMAYLVGSFIGKTPLSSISPNKTWEGTIAGVILAVLIVTKVLGIWIPIQEKFIFLISLVAAIMGNFGDLFESKLKRMAGVKDSGRMMPGHGGFLDRFDSILLATPFVWLLLQILF